MKSQVKIIALSMLFLGSLSFGQTISKSDWTNNELTQYKTLRKLGSYVYKKEKDELSRDSLFTKYIYFDHLLRDPDTARKERRIQAFDTIFDFFRQTVNKIGLENLDAKPIRFYKDHEIYKPFDKNLAKESISGEKMYADDQNVFVWFRKENPGEPLGTLLFEPRTSKLLAWIMIDQGGYKYFLIFNLF
jgi:hypothetical protein